MIRVAASGNELSLTVMERGRLLIGWLVREDRNAKYAWIRRDGIIIRRAMNHAFQPNIYALMCCNASILPVRDVVTNIIKSVAVPLTRPTPLDSS